jgi:hypothetical protein
MRSGKDYTCIREGCVYISDGTVVNLTGFVSGCSPSLQVSAVMVPQTRPRPLPSTSFPSQQSLLMAELLSK